MSSCRGRGGTVQRARVVRQGVKQGETEDRRGCANEWRRLRGGTGAGKDMKMLYLESFIHFFPNKYFIATYPQVHLEDGTFLWAASVRERKRRDPSFALADNCPPRGTAGSLDSPPPLWAWGLEGRTLPGLCELLVRQPYLTVQIPPFSWSDIYQLCSEPKQRGGFPSLPKPRASAPAAVPGLRRQGRWEPADCRLGSSA